VGLLAAFLVADGGVSLAADPPPPHLPGTPDDPLDALYRPALALDAEGRPIITIRLMSGQREVRVRAREGGLIVRPRAAPGEPARTVRAPAGRTLVLSVGEHRPGRLRRHPIVAEVPAAAVTEASLAEIIETWTDRELAVRVESVGSVFGLGGRVIDNRRTLVLLDGPGDAPWAARAAEAASAFLEQTPVLHEIREARPEALVTVTDEGGAVLARGRSHVVLEADDGGPVEVLGVEHGVGYDWHGREDRSYEGVLHIVADDRGLSVVNGTPMETLLRGLVPAETYASAHEEALKAQAVTARTDILAKVGVRHLADPALVCAETHCQVYKGRSAAVDTTDAAVAATAGEVLLGEGGRLIDAVYSAMCGGHTESNEVVWGTPPDPALRGRLDFPAEGEWLRFAAGVGEDDLGAWVGATPPSWCHLASVGAASRFRWSRRITAEEMDRRVAHLGVGSVRRLEVMGRGVSGRVRAVRIVGTTGQAVIRRELPVRRLFGNLNSGMFVVRVERDADGRALAFVFTGGGWGHGVGMCQTGAIGMAEHGHDYRAILRHYYNGTDVARIY
jgi:stage II sporulation protein D